MKKYYLTKFNFCPISNNNLDIHKVRKNQINFVSIFFTRDSENCLSMMNDCFRAFHFIFATLTSAAYYCCIPASSIQAGQRILLARKLVPCFTTEFARVIYFPSVNDQTRLRAHRCSCYFHEWRARNGYEQINKG